MGLFDIFKKKRPTLSEDIKIASSWIIMALNSSGYKVDLTIESLKEIDRFFIENLDDDTHKPKKGGLLSQDTGKRSFAIGSLIGEIAIKNYGGEWITNDRDPQGEVNIAVKMTNGTVIWPVKRVMKRFKEGSHNDMYSYIKTLSL